MVKHTQTIRRLTVFDHFVRLVLKGLNKMVENLTHSLLFVNSSKRISTNESKLNTTVDHIADCLWF